MGVFDEIFKGANEIRYPYNLTPGARAQVLKQAALIRKNSRMNTDFIFQTAPVRELSTEVVGLPYFEYNSELMITIFTTANKKAVEKAMRHLRRQVQWAVGLKDMHTLAAMKKKGFGSVQNPYAVKHFGQGFEFGRTTSAGGHVYWRVHRQSGSLYNSIKQTINEQRGTFKYEGSTGSVYIDEEVAPHAKWVLWGTKRMIGRNFMLWTWQKQQTKVEEIIQKEFDHAMQLWRVRDP